MPIIALASFSATNGIISKMEPFRTSAAKQMIRTVVSNQKKSMGRNNGESLDPPIAINIKPHQASFDSAIPGDYSVIGA
jgi:hypothetical protein